jgi:RND family efflux transporter MFP subunit
MNADFNPLPRLSLSALLPVALLGLSSCEKPQPPMEMPPATVTVAHPAKQKIMEWDEFTGRLDAENSVNLYSQVTGYLQKVHFVDGAEVKVGDVLFTIDPRPFDAAFQMTEAQADRAKVMLNTANSEFERAKGLLASKAIAIEDYDKRLHAVEEATAALKLAQASVDAAKVNVDYTVIKAPINGRIGRHLMDEGGLVVGGPMGATMLANIVSLDPIHCYIDADELSVLKYQRLNREGKRKNAKEDQIPCEMELADETGFPHKGVIDFVDNRLNPSTGTIQARAVFANPKPERGQRVLSPGYFARVRVPATDDYEALVVDETAIGSDQAQKIVLVVNEKNIVMPRPVTVGPVINGKRVIRQGLTENDNVIVNGQARVRPGMPVAPMTQEEAAKAAPQGGPPAH